MMTRSPSEFLMNTMYFWDGTNVIVEKDNYYNESKYYGMIAVDKSYDPSELECWVYSDDGWLLWNISELDPAFRATLLLMGVNNGERV